MRLTRIGDSFGIHRIVRWARRSRGPPGYPERSSAPSSPSVRSNCRSLGAVQCVFAASLVLSYQFLRQFRDFLRPFGIRNMWLSYTQYVAMKSRIVVLLCSAVATILTSGRAGDGMPASTGALAALPQSRTIPRGGARRRPLARGSVPAIKSLTTRTSRLRPLISAKFAPSSPLRTPCSERS